MEPWAKHEMVEAASKQSERSDFIFGVDAWMALDTPLCGSFRN